MAKNGNNSGKRQAVGGAGKSTRGNVKITYPNAGTKVPCCFDVLVDADNDVVVDAFNGGRQVTHNGDKTHVTQPMEEYQPNQHRAHICVCGIKGEKIKIIVREAVPSDGMMGTFAIIEVELDTNCPC